METSPPLERNQRLIYIIEDEIDIAELIRFNLVNEGYSVRVFDTAEDAVVELKSESPSLILLDIMLPGMDGLGFCRKIRSEFKNNFLPIIMLTAKGEEADIVKGLELGADDYLPKPFSPAVLVARIKAVLRRGEPQVIDPTAPLKRGDLILHPGRHEVRAGSQLVDLTKFEFQILHFLMKRPGWVFTRSQIVDAIHGENYAVTDRSIDFQMVGLRKKLGESGNLIETVRGVGYRFRED